jgi:hypothetical protein
LWNGEARSQIDDATTGQLQQTGRQGHESGLDRSGPAIARNLLHILKTWAANRDPPHAIEVKLQLERQVSVGMVDDEEADLTGDPQFSSRTVGGSMGSTVTGNIRSRVFRSMW